MRPTRMATGPPSGDGRDARCMLGSRRSRVPRRLPALSPPAARGPSGRPERDRPSPSLPATGVAVLGTFIDIVPPPAAIRALERLLAWKLSLHGVPAVGHVTVEVDPADAFYTPFKPGAHVSLPRVAGHRQGDSTDCPGDAFFARLPSIRPHVAALRQPRTADAEAAGADAGRGPSRSASRAGSPTSTAPRSPARRSRCRRSTPPASPGSRRRYRPPPPAQTAGGARR